MIKAAGNSARFSLAFLLLIISFSAKAQVSAGPAHSQKFWLQSEDPKLAANKKIVYDFWREVLEAGHLELADQFMTPTYIQHNPNVPTGRQGFIDFFSRFVKTQPIIDSIKAPLISIVAEGDLVVLVFKNELPDPKDPSKKYTTTAFDMLRVENGKVAEHWDADLKH
jgi:predicted SnoaL-like aldol condensation-catalyzing enzyme